MTAKILISDNNLYEKDTEKLELILNKIPNINMNYIKEETTIE